MRKMMSAAFVAVMLMLALQAQAQVKFGVKGGLNITTMKFSCHVLDKSNSEGYYIGPTMKFALPVIGIGVDASALFSAQASLLQSRVTSRLLQIKKRHSPNA